MNKKAVILFSGGLDSTILLYLAKSNGYDCFPLSIDYGQKNKKEIACVKKTLKKLKIKNNKTLKINLDKLGGSALTDKNILVPSAIENSKEIPITYVPARNMLFLSIAASYAETIQAQNIFIGVSQVDYSGYVDCRKEFIDAMELAINKGTVLGTDKNMKMKIHTPFIYKTKMEEIKIGQELNVDFSLTWSCYKGKEKPCGVCDSCKLRQNAFQEANVKDPTLN